MSHNTTTNEQMNAACEMYFATSCTQQQIADAVGVTRKSISIWSKMGRWAEMKANSLRIPAELVDDMYLELAELNRIIHSRPVGERIPTAKEAALRHRILLSIKQTRKQQSVPDMQQTLNAFIRFVKERDTYASSVMESRITDFLEYTDPSGFRPCDIEYTTNKETSDPVIIDRVPIEKPEDAPDLKVSDYKVIHTQHLEQQIKTHNYLKNLPNMIQDKIAGCQELLDVSAQLQEHKDKGEEVTLYYKDGRPAKILTPEEVTYWNNQLQERRQWLSDTLAAWTKDKATYDQRVTEITKQIEEAENNTDTSTSTAA